MAKFLSVRVMTPRDDLFNGEAKAVSAVNSAGPFDILPGHISFVTLIENNEISVLDKDGRRHKFVFPTAVIYCRGDKVGVYG